MADNDARETLILGQPPRLAPLAPEERNAEQQALIAATSPPEQIRQSLGAKDTEWVEIMARHPALFAAHMALAQKLMVDAALLPRDRELAVLRLAWISAAPFEWGGHVLIGKACGVSDAEVARVIAGPQDSGWTERDRAILEAVDELDRTSMIGDATWQVLAAHFDDRQLIEFLMLIGHYKTVAYYQNALRFRLPSGNGGLRAR